MKYYAKPITTRHDAQGITTWLWAGHDGLHCGPELPAGPVPTGHLWGWGPGVRTHLREDATHPTRGILVTDTPTPDTTEVVAMAADDGPFPSIVTDRSRFLRCASPTDQQRFDALTLKAVTLISPTQAVLVSDRRSG